MKSSGRRSSGRMIKLPKKLIDDELELYQEYVKKSVKVTLNSSPSKRTRAATRKLWVVHEQLVPKKKIKTLFQLASNFPRTNFVHIFNGNDGESNMDETKRGDGKRIQRKVLPDDLDILRELSSVEKKLMELHPEIANFQWNTIKSLEGCSPQPMHMDICGDDMANFLMTKDKPLSIIVALMAGTSLLYESGEIKLNPGDVLVFQGDFVHAGAGYKEENLRLHAFGNTKTFIVNSSKTHIMPRLEDI
eukprot:gb/GEZN01016230.1/.p1 GENE.gb/GEZN01016230.1/~~gb/GEZN01016230.1/.p1  ORF type:complete len:247 (+),score=33.91 gb/GEZN01016230.1/:93-833(+)